MEAGSKRLALYGGAGAVAAALAWAGFVYEAEADPLTLLSGAEMQLMQAATIKQAGGEERMAETYGAIMLEVKDTLDRVERAYPEEGMVHYYRGYVAFLEERYLDAATSYARCRAGIGVSAEQQGRALINEALMLRHAGRHAQAARLLEHNRAAFTPALAPRAAAELEAATAAASRVPATPGGGGAKPAAAPQDRTGGNR